MSQIILRDDLPKDIITNNISQDKTIDTNSSFYFGGIQM